MKKKQVQGLLTEGLVRIDGLREGMFFLIKSDTLTSPKMVPGGGGFSRNRMHCRHYVLLVSPVLNSYPIFNCR